MTTFEITITIIVVLGVLLIGFKIYRFEILMSNAIAFFIRTGKQLSSAHADMYDDVGNHYLVEILNKLDNIEGNILDEFIPAFKKLLEYNESIENFWAADSSLVIKLLKEIESDMNEHGIAQAKWFDSMSNKLTTIANHTNETTNKVAELVDFEKRNEQRNDEMFARCEEINKLQLAELKTKVHTYDIEPFPPKDVVGATSTGICQECRGKNECKYFDVNRNRCFVADRKEK